jgi:hypothetical protein
MMRLWARRLRTRETRRIRPSSACDPGRQPGSGGCDRIDTRDRSDCGCVFRVLTFATTEQPGSPWRVSPSSRGILVPLVGR